MKVHVKSYGCSANIAEGEIIEGQLETAEEKNADATIFNICTVKGDAKILREIRKYRKQNPDKKIIITGCISPSIIEPLKKIKAQLISTHHIDKIKEHIKQKEDKLTKAKPVKLLLPRKRKNKTIAIIPICTGCLDACSYCSTRLIKGTLHSYPEEAIIKEAENSKGCKEIWLTGQDTGCYGFDTGTNLVELLKKIVKILGDFKVRIGMGNPRHTTKYLKELIQTMKHPKIFKFIHIPVQSGNNKVLKAMRRGHTVETFKEIVQKIRKEIPDMTISTDIIVGHPTETKEQFEDTLKLVQEIKPDIINIARYAPRPGTTAYEMTGQVHGNIRKQRSRQLTALQRKISLEKNKKWIGWKGEAIVDEKVKDGVSARNYAYKPIVIRKKIPIGKKTNVEITEAHTTYLVGRC
ncbi:tRNA (N(6)-L-threonylcarbamoyladenosine(37)-C(2))-methylthiotransferase [Candidatus Woesearchaeota archaeon]|nr:tRNA (N(6)-L-threonylcarbamoyladenosine(37)-C(2))-methylthiotransferase [Candidatus Woesearchaeota archaeon]